MKNRRMALQASCKTKRIILKVLWLMLWVTSTATAAPTLTIQPDVTNVASCLAFGAAPGSGIQGDAESGFIATSPNMGFIYKNIPAFDLNPGDMLAFDLGDVNDFDIALDIAMAATTANGETTEAGPFVKIVSNTYDPLKARGDTIIDNFDLRFLVNTAYSFPGGGLIIRFSNGSSAYRNDNQSCDQVGVVGMATDTSGNFVLAFWDDDDGISPWGPQQPPISLQEELIGGFQIIEGPTVLLASETLDQSATPITATTVGETNTYRVKAQNPDSSDATGVTVTVTLDNFASFVPASQNPPGAIFDPGPPATIVWSIGSLATGTEATLEFDLDVPLDAGGQLISNVAEVTTSDAPFITGLSDQSDVAVATAIDIVGEILDPSGSPITSIQVGEPFVYRITASNSSQIDGSGIEVTITLPENILFQQANATPPAIIMPDAGPPETVLWTIGNLNSGENTTLDIDLTAIFAASGAALLGTTVLTAPSQGDEVPTSMNVDSAIDIVSRTLDADGVAISTARTGDVVSYEIVVTNLTEVAATGLEVTATLSEDLAFLQSTPTPAATTTFDVGPPATIVWEIDTLPAGAGTEATLLVDLDVPFAASGQPVRNSLQLTASDAQALVGGGTFSDITVDDAIALNVSTLDATGAEITSADISDSINYQVVVTNSGGVAATGLEVVVTLADSLAFLQATTAQSAATYNAGSPATVTWSLGSLSAESAAMLDIELSIEFGAGGLNISNATEIVAADAPLVIGLTAESEITISTTGVDLLNGGSGNCFIATAAYGSYLEPEVMVLRRFRDKYLLTNEPGRTFVAWYYRNSPELAARIADNEAARVVVRLLLSPIVYAVKYPLPAIFSILSIGFIGWKRRAARPAR